MDTAELTEQIAKPLGTVGMMFYFSPQSAERAKAIDMDIVTLYAAGRGGVLGDRSPEEIEEIFYFFHPGMVAGLVDKARGITTLDLGVTTHMDAANDYADATFGGIDDGILIAFSAAVRALAETLPKSRWPIVDGYLALDVPNTPRHEAHYWVVIMREIRGGLHTDAVKDLGLSPLASCQLDRGGASFTLLGYSDEDRVEETDELITLRAAVELETSTREAALLEVLSDSQRDALLDGALAMRAALKNPVAAD